MANDNYPRGLVPLNFDINQAHYYRVATATDIFLGMPVSLASTGFVGGAATGGAGGVVVLGVAIGFAGTLKRGTATNDPFLDVSDLAPPSPTSDTGDRWVLVADNPTQEFYIQEDSGGTALAIADIGASASLVFRGQGNTVDGNVDTGWANLELDASTIAAATDGVLTVLGLHDAVNSDGTENSVGDFAKWVVRITNHQKVGLQAVAQV